MWIYQPSSLVKQKNRPIILVRICIYIHVHVHWECNVTCTIVFREFASVTPSFTLTLHHTCCLCCRGSLVCVVLYSIADVGAKFIFLGLFFYVYMGSPNPKEPRRPRTTSPKPHQTLFPKLNPRPKPPNHHKWAKVRKIYNPVKKCSVRKGIPPQLLLCSKDKSAQLRVSRRVWRL